jgi:hypothetical protein
MHTIMPKGCHTVSERTVGGTSLPRGSPPAIGRRTLSTERARAGRVCGECHLDERDEGWVSKLELGRLPQRHPSKLVVLVGGAVLDWTAVVDDPDRQPSRFRLEREDGIGRPCGNTQLVRAAPGRQTIISCTRVHVGAAHLALSTGAPSCPSPAPAATIRRPRYDDHDAPIPVSRRGRRPRPARTDATNDRPRRPTAGPAIDATTQRRSGRKRKCDLVFSTSFVDRSASSTDSVSLAAASSRPSGSMMRLSPEYWRPLPSPTRFTPTT